MAQAISQKLAHLSVCGEDLLYICYDTNDLCS